MNSSAYISAWVTRDGEMPVLMQAIEALRIRTSVLDTSLNTRNASLASSVGEQGHGALVSRPFLA